MKKLAHSLLSLSQITYLKTLLIIAIFITEIAGDIYLPTMPLLVTYFKTTEQLISLSLNMGFLGFCIAAPFCGPASDKYGRKPLILLGMLIFSLGSFACSSIDHIYGLLMGRFLQGFGLSPSYIVGMAMLKDIYPEKSFAKVMASIHLIVAIAPALGPIIGGYITEYFFWQLNFILLAILSVLIFFGMLPMPETLKNPTTSFSVRETLSTYRRILTNPLFIGYSSITGLTFAGFWAYLSYIPFVFEEQGVSIVSFTYYQWATIIAYMIGTVLNQKTIDVYGIQRLLIWSLRISLLGGVLLLAVALAGILTPWVLCGCMCIYCLGSSGIFVHAATCALSIFEDEKGTAASALGAIESLYPALVIGILSAMPKVTFLFQAIGVFVCAYGAYYIHKRLLNKE